MDNTQKPAQPTKAAPEANPKNASSSSAAASAPVLPLKLKKQLREASASAPDVEVKAPPAKPAKTVSAVSPEPGFDPLLDVPADAAATQHDVSPEADLAQSKTTDNTKAAESETSPTALAQNELAAENDAAQDDASANQPAPPESASAPGQKSAEAIAAKAIEDPQTDAAVDEIVAAEADTVLAAEDEARAETASLPRSSWRRFTGFFARWWANKLARWLTIFVIVAAIGTACVVPKSRYFLLNMAGVRSSLTLTALDDTTQLPLKNVTVSLGSYQAKTNSKGTATLHGLKLGNYQLTVQRLAFAPVHQAVTVGWGSNQLGNFSLHATGVQYIVMATDYVSGKGIAGIEASDGDATAVSDAAGKITLTVSVAPADGLAVTVAGNGYRSAQVTIPATATTPTAITLVPSAREVYVSKQSGTYGVYATDIDGQNKKLLLAGTGRETANLQLATSLDGQRAALVSTRDDIRDADGYLLSTLTLINTADGSSITLEHAEQVQLIDWIGSKVIYETVVAGASAANPQRQRIYSYDYKTNAHVQLAGANQFNLATTVSGAVYYAVSGTDPSASPGLYKVNTDATGRQQLFSREVWSAFRTDYGTLALQSPSGWFSLVLSSHAATASTAPAQYKNRLYAENAEMSHSAWVDDRDGKGVLLAHDDASGKDTVVVSQDILTYPVRWLDDDLVAFRVASAQETADYVVRPSGGPAKKVTDVTNAYSFSQGY